MKKDLSYQEARDLQFFCRNVTGVREEFYKVIEGNTKLEEKLNRLEKTAEIIKKYFGDQFKEESEFTKGKTPIL